jgi:phage shock protein A
LLQEKAQLDGRVRIALDDNRDDLAEAGIARQIDIDAQVGVLDRLLTDTDEKIAQFGQTLDAVAASRREAEQTLKDFRASQAENTHGSSSGGHAGGSTNGAMNKVARAQAATARVSGVPTSPGAADAQALNELADLERRREVQARLAKLKSGRNA